MTIGVAILGYGLAGRAFHAPLVEATPGLALRRLVTSREAEALARYPDVSVSRDIGHALVDPEVELVVVATPDALHAEHAIAALRAGKHVVVDKPMAETLAHAQAMAAAAKAAGRQLIVFHNRRWDADFLTLRRLIDEGRIGEIALLESHFDRFRPAVTDRWKEAIPGGPWHGLGPHLVDQALLLLGRPEGVTADFAVQREGGRGIDFCHVVLRYPKARAVLQMGTLLPDNRLRFAVHGTGGSWIKHGLDPQEAQSEAGMRPGEEGWGVDPHPGLLTSVDDGLPGEPGPVDNLAGDYRAFYAGVRDCLLGLAPSPVPIDQALDVMTVLDMGARSAAERREIGWGEAAQ